MKIINNNLYLNRSLKPVLISINPTEREYSANSIEGTTNYVVSSSGSAAQVKNIILDIGFLNLFNDCNFVYITNNFEVIYANDNKDWFARSDIFYGLRTIKTNNDDLRFVEDSISKKISINRFKSGSDINTKLADKYFILKKIINNYKWS